MGRPRKQQTGEEREKSNTSKKEIMMSKKEQAKKFNKRKDGILKKAMELSTLCEVDVCAIIFGPNGGPPHVWPNEPENVTKVLEKYQNMSLEQRAKGATNLSSFSKESQQKNSDNDEVKSEVSEIGKNNNSIDDLSVVELMGLVDVIESKLGVVNNRIDVIKRSQIGLMNSHNHEDGMMMMMDDGMGMGMGMGMPSGLQCGYPVVVDDDHDYDHGYDEDHQRDAEVMMNVMMMNGGDECNGFMGMKMAEDCYNVEGGMWNPIPLSWNCDQFTQFNGGQLAYNYCY